MLQKCSITYSHLNAGRFPAWPGRALVAALPDTTVSALRVTIPNAIMVRGDMLPKMINAQMSVNLQH